MKKTNKLILVSNDDGYQSPGIKALAQSLKKIPGVDVVVVAPDREQSATSHALTLHRPLRVLKVKKGVFAVDGTPTDSVMLAVHSILKRKPDLLVSGINKGANVGEDVHYSGTVSAALEGAIMGIPGIAVSVISKGAYRFEAAAVFARKLASHVLMEGLPKGVVLNVNAPSLPPKQIKGHVVCRLGRHHYGDVIVEKVDPRGRPYFWIGGDPHQFEDVPGTDCRAYLNNQISVVPIQVDLTDKSFLETLKKWKL